MFDQLPARSASVPPERRGAGDNAPDEAQADGLVAVPGLARGGPSSGVTQSAGEHDADGSGAPRGRLGALRRKMSIDSLRDGESGSGVTEAARGAVVRRAIDPATPKDATVRGPRGQQFRVEKIVGAGASGQSTVPMCLLIPIDDKGERSGVSRLVRLDDPDYSAVPKISSGPAPAPSAPTKAPSADDDTDTTTLPFPSVTTHSLEWWFNYFWSEISDASKIKARALAHEYATAEASTRAKALAAVKAEMESMFNEGMIEISQDAGTVTPKQISKGSDKDPAYNVDLPRLSGSGLGYRADTRSWDTIKKQHGSKPIGRVDALRSDKNFDKDWNPFNVGDRLKKMYLRRHSQDNALESVVSVAEDLRDTVTFPKPNQSAVDGGGTATGGEERITIYVVVVDKVLDTSGLALELFGAARWQRGEVGAYEIGADDHLAKFTVRRFYDPRVDSFVVGKVENFEVLADKTRTKTLSTEAGDALNALSTKFGAGELTWLRFGAAEKDNERHKAMERMWQLSNDALEAEQMGGSLTIKRMAKAAVVDDYKSVWTDVKTIWPKEAAAANRWLAQSAAQPWGNAAPAAAVGQALQKQIESLERSFAQTRLPWVRLRSNAVWDNLRAAQAEILALAKEKDAPEKARAIGLKALTAARREITDIAAAITARLAFWDKRLPNAQTAAAWEAFLMDVLGDQGPNQTIASRESLAAAAPAAPVSGPAVGSGRAATTARAGGAASKYGTPPPLPGQVTVGAGTAGS